ncbi:MAG: DNA repair protein RecN [Clostridiales bacterium]|nr:DNA repair protein RecN [Clostridiales bacterium]
MLTLLHIENIAVVERADLEPGPGLNVLTGETGAGKSIIIDAIGAIAGERTSKDLIRTGEKSATVNALFCGLSPSVLSWLDENGYAPDEDGNLLISRQITSDGRSICRINGVPVTVSQLKTLGSLLLNIHGQHDNQSLLDESTHLSYLDSFAGHHELIDGYRAKYKELKEIEKAIESIAIDEEEKSRRIDELRYRIGEIEAADLQVDEEERLEARRTILRNSERMTAAIEECFRSLYGDEDSEGACGLLNIAESAISLIASMDPQLEAIREKLSDIRYVAEDIASEVRDLRDEYIYSPEEMERVESRLALIHQLKRKYGNSIEQILKRLKKDKEELDKIEFSDEELEKLKKRYSAAYNEVIAAGEKLSRSRTEKAEELSEKIMNCLSRLDMPKVRFKVDIVRKDAPDHDGLDTVKFILSANPGEELRAISKIASGGELSRIMLAMKNVLVRNDDIQTLIFDEVDTGVSGRAAQRVAEMLAEVSKEKQVLCVTHLSQIAAMADNHFNIEKKERGGRVYTSVALLDEESAAREIARIISGANITDATMKSAHEMICDAKEYKNKVRSEDSA